MYTLDRALAYMDEELMGPSTAAEQSDVTQA